MGLIRGGLLFVLSSLLMFTLLAANLSLTFSMSLEENSLQSAIFSDLPDVNGQEVDLNKQVEENFDLLVEHCENNTSFEFSHEGYEVNIPCEVVDEGPDAVVEEGFNDVVESAIEQQYPDSGFGAFSRLLFSSNASDYWMNYFYIVLMVIFVLALTMFFATEEKLNFPITFGFLIITSSVPFAAVNFLLPLLEKSVLLNPISILFAEAYTVFLGAIILGASLVIFGFGFKFFKIGWSWSEKFGKLKGIFGKKSEAKEVQK